MNKIIMVVEDNDDIREIIEILLKDEQYDVSLCNDAKSFKKNIAIEFPDLIIMDVMLPDGNGLDLCAELKKTSRTENIPVLVMSAHASISDVNIVCNPNGFIKKPFDIEFFVNKVAEVFKSSVN